VNFGISDGKTAAGRECPALFVMAGSRSSDGQITISGEIKEQTGAELRKLADRADASWAAWQEYRQEMLDLEAIRKSRLHPVMEDVCSQILRPCPLTDEVAS